MGKHFSSARVSFIGLAAALILSPALFAQSGHGGAGYGGGAHASPLSYGAPMRSQGVMGAPVAGAHGPIGPAVVPPIASSGRWYFSTGNGAYQYGNRPHNPGSGYRRYPPGYIPYYVAAYPYFYLGGGDAPAPAEAYGPPPQPQDQPDGLAMELDAIHQELAELKQRQTEAPPYGMAPPEAPGPVVERAPTKPQDPPLVLVFRDGTQTEIRDFAVVGQTFWDFGRIDQSQRRQRRRVSVCCQAAVDPPPKIS
jgi:hypothetical protein